MRMHLAVLSMLVSGCSAEDSVKLPAFQGSGGVSNAAQSGTVGAAIAGSPGRGPMGAGSPGSGTAGASVSAPKAGSSASSAGSGATPVVGGMGSPAPSGAGGMVSGGATSSPGSAQAPDCDMNGYWASRMLSITDALSADQCASLYGFYELRQQGANVEVVKYFDCGLRATGSGDASYSPATRTALLSLNSQVGRKGTMMKGADGTCQLSMEPFWHILGADVALLPSDRKSAEKFATVQAAQPLPGKKGAPGLVDVESDGFAGIATVVTNSAVTGTRHGVIRNVQSWKTDAFYKITPSTTWAEDIEARLSYIGEENAIEAYDEQKLDSPFLTTLAVPQPQADAARITLHFLGRDAADPRAQKVVVSSDLSDAKGALATCDNIINQLKPITPIYGLTQRCPCPNGMASDQNRKCAP